MEEEAKRVSDSIDKALEAEAAAAALAERLAREKEEARLAMEEKSRLDAEKNKLLDLQNEIDELGYVYFDFDSSYLNEKSKNTPRQSSCFNAGQPNVFLLGGSACRFKRSKKI